MRTPVILLAATMLCFSANARAHSVTLDGSATEWFGIPAPVANLARVSRSSAGEGEWVWRDASGDALAGSGAAADLLELRLTGDGTKLHVLARISPGLPVAGDGAPQLMLAIDTDRFPGSGGTQFPEGAALAVADEAAYEWVLETRFGSQSGPCLVDPSGARQAAGSEALSSGGVMEVSVPWSALGFPEGPPSRPIRVSAALFRASALDTPSAVTGTASRAADVLTQYGDPGAALTTAAETADGRLDHWSDVWFSPRGECYSPLTVSELCFDGGSQVQWVELYNNSPDLLALGSFKVGDAAEPDLPSESMGRLPSVLLPPGSTFVIARNGAAYLARYGMHADAECESADPGTPDLTPFPQWSNSTAFNVTAAGDEMLVLDAGNTVVDVLTFKNGSWPGVVPHAGVGPDHSIERVAPNQDRDDCAADFADQAAPTPESTPGVLAVDPAGAPHSHVVMGSPWPNPSRTGVSLALRVGADALLDARVFDLAGREVARLAEASPATSGARVLSWDGRRAGAGRVAPGVYLVRVSTGGETRWARVAMLGR